MAPLYLKLLAIILCFGVDLISTKAQSRFDDNYITDWGDQHFTYLDDRRQVQILINESSGGGFRSKVAYGSGQFRISLKTPSNAAGIATTFYLTSVPDNESGAGNHDELDFELLGSKDNGRSYILNTNIFAQDSGHREQQFKLWFDPTSDFHDYGILWNQKQIVFFIDKMPIRVFKNNTKTNYPKLPMYIHGSLWNGSQWLGQTNWSREPFIATYRGFEIDGCSYDFSNPQKCSSSQYPWNQPDKWSLNPKQQRVYEVIRNKSIIYDYCKSVVGGSNTTECSNNSL